VRGPQEAEPDMRTWEWEHVQEMINFSSLFPLPLYLPFSLRVQYLCYE